MRKLALTVAITVAAVVSAFADEYVRVVKPVPAETNAIVRVSFDTAVTPVAFRILGDAGTNTTASVALVSSTAGYQVETPLVTDVTITNAAVAISASGYAQTAYKGDYIEVTVANATKDRGAVVIYAKK